MNFRFPLTGYIERAMAQVVYEDLGDGTFGGTIPPCWGVMAFGNTIPECLEELQSTLEDWILMGLHRGDRLPVIDGIDLNLPAREQAGISWLAKTIADDFYNDRFDWSERDSVSGRAWERMPEVAAVRQLQDAGVSDSTVRLFITFVAAMDRARNAKALWRAGAQLFAVHPELFEPAQAAAIPLSELRHLLSTSRLSQRHRDDVGAWHNIAITLSTEKDCPVRRVIDNGVGDARKLLPDLRRKSNGRNCFPLLRGDKIGPMWVRMMAAPGNAEIANIDIIPVAVDTHVKRVTENLGLTDTRQLSVDRAKKPIQEAWRKAVNVAPIGGLSGIANTCAALDPALWLFGKHGCAHCEKEKRLIPISDACARCKYPFPSRQDNDSK